MEQTESVSNMVCHRELWLNSSGQNRWLLGCRSQWSTADCFTCWWMFSITQSTGSDCCLKASTVVFKWKQSVWGEETGPGCNNDFQFISLYQFSFLWTSIRKWILYKLFHSASVIIYWSFSRVLLSAVWENSACILVISHKSWERWCRASGSSPPTETMLARILHHQCGNNSVQLVLGLNNNTNINNEWDIKRKLMGNRNFNSKFVI